MAAPNFDPRYPQNNEQNQQQQPYFPPPPGPPPSQTGQQNYGASNKPPRSPADFPQYNASSHPANEYPPPPQGYFPAQHGGYASPGPYNQARDPRAPRQGNEQHAPSPVPSFSNQIAPFSDEKAQSHYPYGSGPIPQHDYARDYGNDYQGHAPQHRAERGHDHDRELSDSKSSADEARGHKDRKHGAHKSDDKHGRGLRGLTDEQRSLGASMLGGAGGALIGHKLGGTLGAIGGILVGAIGATKLEEKREER
ncbi:hypothetical protein ANO11243_042830 [Dothideomycetidae sp. 11243]|nr:hypothetical protein ANO11243_042830 [fungal sp. No.11243]